MGTAAPKRLTVDVMGVLENISSTVRSAPRARPAMGTSSPARLMPRLLMVVRLTDLAPGVLSTFGPPSGKRIPTALPGCAMGLTSWTAACRTLDGLSARLERLALIMHLA